MTSIVRTLGGALPLLCALSLPALADSAAYSLTGSWQKIASAGQSVDVQNRNGNGFAVLSTSSAGVPSTANGQALGAGDHRVYTLGADLYALGNVTVVVTTGFGGNPLPAILSQTSVTLIAGVSSALIGANGGRKSLRWMVTGSNPMTVAPGTASAAVGAGMNYNGGQGAGTQGGAESFEGPAVPTGAFQAISAAGTTVTVWEGQ